MSIRTARLYFIAICVLAGAIVAVAFELPVIYVTPPFVILAIVYGSFMFHFFND